MKHIFELQVKEERHSQLLTQLKQLRKESQQKFHGYFYDFPKLGDKGNSENFNMEDKNNHFLLLVRHCGNFSCST